MHRSALVFAVAIPAVAFGVRALAAPPAPAPTVKVPVTKAAPAPSFTASPRPPELDDAAVASRRPIKALSTVDKLRVLRAAGQTAAESDLEAPVTVGVNALKHPSGTAMFLYHAWFVDGRTGTASLALRKPGGVDATAFVRVMTRPDRRYLVDCRVDALPSTTIDIAVESRGGAAALARASVRPTDDHVTVVIPRQPERQVDVSLQGKGTEGSTWGIESCDITPIR